MWKKLLCCYSVLVVIFTIMIISVHLIPTYLIRDNVYRSACKINDEGIFHKIGGIMLFQIDNMTDCMLMNMAATADEHYPIESAMNNYYSCNRQDEGYVNMALNTIKLAKEGQQSLPERVHYGRYWQGSQCFLRPLLLFTNYTGIRIINYILLSFLLLWLIWLMKISFGWGVPILLLVSLLMVSIPIVPLSIQLSICFYLMLLGSIFVMYFSDIKNAPIVFFIIGILTSYFDFLTIPQITLGIPLILLLLKNHINNKYRIVLILSLAWLGGYSIFWASKWLVAYLLTGQSIMDSVYGSISLRLSNSVVFHGVEIDIDNLLILILGKIRWWMIMAFCILLIVIGLLYYKYQKGKYIIYSYSWLLIVAIIVPVWFLCLRNHSVQHIFFTWRALLLPLFSLMLFVYLTTKKQNIYEQNNSHTNTLLQ